ncbi:MAG: ubiquinol-cytochrome c reductase iron-sulfur subunit [Deltaproteobacteria bacterium]|jgi:cytochrome b6-f complex iron-sulfur subunit|nr:ubiquinol-cytochrome c reductase iron-sulfur subunit [Deltaproteobacteria bacterium]
MSNPKEKKSETGSTRRSFLNVLWLILGGVALAEFVAVAFAFLRPRKLKARREDADSIIIAGVVERFEPNSVTAFVRGKFYLARLQDGGFLAISRTCTHLGCTIPWIEKEMKFACPCHGSAFDITGNVIEAPAPRALDIYPITIENQIIVVDTRKPIKRSSVRVEQVEYPKKKS